MKSELIYLDTYVLQKDMRIRLPKSIIENLHVEKGTSEFKIYFDRSKSELILRVAQKSTRA